MKAFTDELIAEVAAMPTYSAMRDYLLAVKRTAATAAQILDNSIQTFERLGRVATVDEHAAIEAEILAVVAAQPDTFDFV